MAAGQTRTSGARAGRDRRRRRGQPSRGLSDGAGHPDAGWIQAGHDGAGSWDRHYQLARAQGAGKVISTAGSAAKAAKASELGFEDVVDLTTEGVAEGVRRTTAGKGVDIVIESIGGAVTSEALSSLCLGGVLITLGYSAGRKTTIDVTDLIWKRARMAGFSLFAQSPTAIAAAWRDVMPLMVSGSVKPIVERVHRFGEAGEALRHLIEDRPFGKVMLAG